MLFSGLPQGARVNHLLYGQAAMWTPEVAQYATTNDLLAAANWQRGGGKGSRPKPTKPPRIPDHIRVRLPDDL